MACLDLYNQNPDHKSSSPPPIAPPMSPRISFSNDFVESTHSPHHHHHHHHHHHPHQTITKPRSDGPDSSDFEFSAMTNIHHSMISADEVFFKGRMLPFKDGCTGSQLQQKTTTLRDELLAGEDDDYDDVLARPPKGSSTRWKDLLGLRKPHIGPNKSAKIDGFVEKAPVLVPEEALDIKF